MNHGYTFLVLIALFLLLQPATTSPTNNETASLFDHVKTSIRMPFPRRCLRFRQRCRLRRGPPCCGKLSCQRTRRKGRRTLRRCALRTPSSIPPAASASPSSTPSMSPSPSPFSCVFGDDPELVANCRCFFEDPSLFPSSVTELVQQSSVCGVDATSNSPDVVELDIATPVCRVTCPDMTVRTSFTSIEIQIPRGSSVNEDIIAIECLARITKPIVVQFQDLQNLPTCEAFIASLPEPTDGSGRTMITFPRNIIQDANCGISATQADMTKATFSTPTSVDVFVGICDV